MEVILLERVEKLGLMGDVVNVKPGYARNYLLPKNKAISELKQTKNSLKINGTSMKLQTSKQKLKQKTLEKN